jgi:hypothetical protein
MRSKVENVRGDGVAANRDTEHDEESKFAADASGQVSTSVTR